MARKASAREWFRITRNEAAAVDIDIYDDIGESYNWMTDEKEGIGAKAFLEAVREAEGKAINLHVNSGGGNVYDAFAMMTALAAHEGKVTAYVEGIAASAASYLVAAADEVVISSEAWMMIHRASVFDWGNAAMLRETADWLDKLDRQVAGIYAKRSGSKDLDEFQAAMAETTWFTADEAVAWGLADRIEEAVAAAACFTGDSATWRSAPQGAMRLLREGPSRARRGEASGDTSENIPSDAGEPGAQEPPAAQERVAVVGGKPYIVKERTTDEP